MTASYYGEVTLENELLVDDYGPGNEFTTTR